MEIKENADLASRLLNVMEHDILPLTEKGVADGNKVFGGALLRKSDLSLVMAQTNNETENPLWHGEVHLLKCFYEQPVSKTESTRDMIFLSTHEPCTMCMSAIAWAGLTISSISSAIRIHATALPFHTTSRSSRRSSGRQRLTSRQRASMCSTRRTGEVIASLPDLGVEETRTAIDAALCDLSQAYQASKDDNAIPLN